MIFTKNGFSFRADWVIDGEVYIARWHEGHIGDPEHGDLARVPLEVWNTQMADVPGALERVKELMETKS